MIAQDGRLKTGDIILTVNHALISHFQLHQVRSVRLKNPNLLIGIPEAIRIPVAIRISVVIGIHFEKLSEPTCMSSRPLIEIDSRAQVKNTH